MLLFGTALGGEYAGNVEPDILIEPVSLEAVTGQRDAGRVLHGIIGGTAVVAGDFGNLDVQVLAVAGGREPQLAAPGNLGLVHPRAGIALLIGIVDPDAQESRRDGGPLDESRVGVGRCGQFPILGEQPELIAALRVGAGGDGHVLGQHIDPGVASHEPYAGNGSFRPQVQYEGGGDGWSCLGRPDGRACASSRIVEQAGIRAQVAVDHLLGRILAGRVRKPLGVGCYGDRTEFRRQRTDGEKERQKERCECRFHRISRTWRIMAA